MSTIGRFCVRIRLCGAFCSVSLAVPMGRAATPSSLEGHGDGRRDGRQKCLRKEAVGGRGDCLLTGVSRSGLSTAVYPVWETSQCLLRSPQKRVYFSSPRLGVTQPFVTVLYLACPRKSPAFPAPGERSVPSLKWALVAPDC